ncbi:MAG: septum formation family protein [Propionibacteriaceae bacterium]|nr:septum formation family protein [Propionibacteriaceae bacterium]
MKTPKIVAAASAALLVLASLSACSLLGGGNAFDLEVGDCIITADLAEAFSDVPTQECSVPHDAEIIGKHASAVGDTYDEAAIAAEAEVWCNDDIESYVGPNWVDTDLIWGYFYPDPEAWSNGKRTVMCYAVTYDGESSLTSSVRGMGN